MKHKRILSERDTAKKVIDNYFTNSSYNKKEKQFIKNLFESAFDNELEDDDMDYFQMGYRKGIDMDDPYNMDSKFNYDEDDDFDDLNEIIGDEMDDDYYGDDTFDEFGNDYDFPEDQVPFDNTFNDDTYYEDDDEFYDDLFESRNRRLSKNKKSITESKWLKIAGLLK